MLGVIALAYVAIDAHGLNLAALLGVGAAGLALLLVGMGLNWRPGIALGQMPLAAAVATVLVLRGPVILAPLLGAILLVMSELGFWAVDESAPGVGSRRLRIVLAARTAVMAVLGFLLGLVVLALAGLRASGGLDLTLIGSLAAVGVLVLAVFLLRAGVRREPD